MRLDIMIPVAMFIVALGSLIVAIIVAGRGRQQDEKDAGERDGMLLSEIGYVKSGIDDIKTHQRTQDERHLETVERLTAVEQSAKQAHHRIDRIEGRDEP